MYDKKERTHSMKKPDLKLREDLIKALGGNLVCLLRTGSRVRGEATRESDYDVSVIVRTIDSSLIEKIRMVFLDYPDFSAYVLSEHELETLPRAQLLQFLYVDKLYGDIEYELPTKEEVKQYISLVRREWLDRLRHYLDLPALQREAEKKCSLRPETSISILVISSVSRNGQTAENKKTNHGLLQTTEKAGPRNSSSRDPREPGLSQRGHNGKPGVLSLVIGRVFQRIAPIRARGKTLIVDLTQEKILG